MFRVGLCHYPRFRVVSNKSMSEEVNVFGILLKGTQYLQWEVGGRGWLWSRTDLNVTPDCNTH